MKSASLPNIEKSCDLQGRGVAERLHKVVKARS